MMVSIELFGTQRDIAKIDKISIPIAEQTIVGDVLDYLRRDYPALTLDGDSFLITVNHELAPPDRLLRANDVICILPHIGGG
jgi:molybdopterin converting factor small subunit